MDTHSSLWISAAQGSSLDYRHSIDLETHYRGSGHSAQAIASGTLVSLGLLAIYAALATL